ncbi:DUF924 family protein [Maritalea sp.]|uniref:DUF924 family protein n=1 Tax=Maritalea sp. TaxID=2003361 RepID=UPI003F4ABC4F
MIVNPEDITQFWFVDHGPKDWFSGGDEFDQKIVSKFSQTHAAAHKGELFSWRTSPENRLAEIIVLDQFTRQIYRKSPRAFACDPIALTLAQEMVVRGDDLRIAEERRSFAYMPYMHCESLAVHDEAMKLFDALPGDDSLDYEIKHRAMIEKFGRYPYRNEVLGRQNTPEEDAFLAQDHDSFGQ